VTKTDSNARNDTEEAFLDAAERLLVEVGYAGITTRRVAEAAGANHGLVHYYFGSMENLLVRVLERFTARLITRQRATYAAEGPFIDKWRQAMQYLDEDRPYQKIWYELQALSWNNAELGDRVARVREEWYAVLAEAFEQARREHDLDIPGDALVALVATFNEGIILERLSGVDGHHASLLGWIDTWLEATRR